MAKKINEITEEQLAILGDAYPIIDDVSRQTFPRLGVIAEDITEETGTGKNKKIKVIQSAGTFYTEKDEGETDKDGKKKWTKNFLDAESIDAIIAYHRYQLKIYDKSLKKYISSPIYDRPEQILPLYLDRQVIKRGTEKELQSLYPELTLKGKPTTGLKKQMVLYVIMNGEMYQMETNQSSQYSFKDYKKTVNIPAVVTSIGSTAELAGGTKYRKLNFKMKRAINSEEFETIVENQTLLKDQVENDNTRFLAAPKEDTSEKEMDEIAESAVRQLK